MIRSAAVAIVVMIEETDSSPDGLNSIQLTTESLWPLSRSQARTHVRFSFRQMSPPSEPKSDSKEGYCYMIYGNLAQR